MGPTNAIREALIARVKALMVKLDESNSINHGGVKGDLREAYLAEFLALSLQPQFELTSGFITDACGTCITPQIDIIVLDSKTAPAISLGFGKAIVPVESMRVAIEVKSDLKTSDKEQIIAQTNSLNSLVSIGIGKERLLSHTQRRAVCLFAYSSSVADSTRSDWIEEIPSLLAVCIPKKNLLYGTTTVETINPTDEFDEVLHFISFLHDIALQMGNSFPDLGLAHSLKPYVQSRKLTP